VSRLIVSEKLNNVRGDLVANVRVDETLLSYMMGYGCLSKEEKFNIQRVRALNSLRCQSHGRHCLLVFSTNCVYVYCDVHNLAGTVRCCFLIENFLNENCIFNRFSPYPPS